MNEEEFNRFVEKCVTPLKADLEWWSGVQIAQTLVKVGFIPRWKGLDTVHKLRHITKYMPPRFRPIWRRFIKGLVGPIPDKVPRLMFKPLHVVNTDEGWSKKL